MTEAEDRARAVRDRLDEDDRIAIALGEFDRVTDPGVVPFVYVDGPNGVRGADGATAFPSALAIAASMDRALAADYGAALAREVRASGSTVLLGPVLDIARVPQGGRNGEGLGEDPVLAGELGGTIAAGVQGEGVLAVLKHYVANNFEWLRTGAGFPERSAAMDVRVDPRTLTDLYLEPFRRAVVHHGGAALMGSYNRIDGEYVCQSPALLALPRTDWGFAGVTVPDFLFAVRDPEAALDAGLDLPGLGGASGRTAEELRARPDRLHDAVLHVLTAAELVGLRPPAPDPAALGTEAARDLAERIAIEGAVLLRNERATLPLDRRQRIAVIDAATATELLVIGGSAAVRIDPARVRGLDEVLRETHDVEAATATDGERPGEPFAAPDVRATVRTADGERELRLDTFALEAPEGAEGDWSAVVTARITPTAGGVHRFTAEFAGKVRLLVDDVLVGEGFREASPFVEGPRYVLHAAVDLDAGREVEVRAEYASSVAIRVPIPGSPIAPHLRVAWEQPDDRIASAARAAGGADVAVIVTGRVTGEGMDADGLRLPGRQEALIEAVAAAAARTVVVTLGAGPVRMPWLDRVDAVLHAWFPGERFAEAVARVLTGDAEPGGRLPLTWPAGRGPLTEPEQYPGQDGRAEYLERDHVGYRWFRGADEAPAFPFGHGLGYTTFAVGDPVVRVEDEAVEVVCSVHNTGSRAGKAVVQAYVTLPDPAAPAAQLADFAVARIEAGASREVTMRIRVDDLARSDDEGRRSLRAGDYRVAVGLSADDLRGTAGFTLDAEEHR